MRLKKEKLLTWLLLGVILLLAFSVRIPDIGKAGLWNDEAIVAAVAERPFGELLRKVRQDAHPPLFFILQRFVRLAVGFDGWTEGAARSISLFFGIISIAVIYGVGRQMMSKKAGLLAAFLLAVNPMHIHYSREARNYALLILLTLLAMLCVVLMHQRPKLRTGLFTGLVFLALIYTHSISFFVLAPLGAMLLLSFFSEKKHGQIPALIGTVGVTLVGLLPWLPTLFSQVFQISKTATTGSGPIEWVRPHWEKLFPWQVPYSFGAMSHGSMPPVDNYVDELRGTVWFALAISAFLIAAGWRYRSSWREPWSGYLLAAGCLGSLCLLFIASWVGTPIYTPGRVDTLALPAFILLIASGIQGVEKENYSFFRRRSSSEQQNDISPRPNEGIWQLVLWFIPVLLLTGLAVQPIQDEIEAVRGEQNKRWIRYFSQYTADGDVFIVTGKWWTSFEYYLPRFGKNLHLLGFPSSREKHPNWLDWSVYTEDLLRKDADSVARKAAQLAAVEGSTVWVYPGLKNSDKLPVLLQALEKQMTSVSSGKRPSLRGTPYFSFRSKKLSENSEGSLLEATIHTAQLAPHSLRLQYKAGMLLESSGDHSGAIPYFQRIVDMQPDYRAAGFQLGFSYQKVGKSEKAIASYRHFLQFKPDHVQTHFNLGYELMKRDDCTSAIEHFKRVLALKPNYYETHYHLSKCYRILGDISSAQYHLGLYRKEGNDKKE